MTHHMGTAANPTPAFVPLGRSGSAWVAGSGAPLLLLHGWGLHPRVYVPGLALLAQQGFRIAAPSMGVVGKQWSVDRAVHRAVKTLDHMEWPEAIVVGNSLGGAVAITLAARNPGRVRLLVLVNSVGLQLDRGVLGWTLPFRRYVTAANLRAAGALGRNLFAPRGVVNLAGAAWYAKSAGLSSELEAVAENGVPSVLMWGEQDRLLPLEMGRAIARALGARLRIIPGADHDWTVRQPVRFAQELEITIRAGLDERSQSARAFL